MIDRIYGIPATAALWQNDPELPEYFPMPSQTVEIATNATDIAYLVGSGGFDEWNAITEAYLVGSWDSETGLQEGQSYDEFGVVQGTPTYPVTSDYAVWIRPLGNESGKATGVLDSTRWAGHAEPKFLQDDKRYPDTEAPFTLKIYRENHGADAPAWDIATNYVTGDYATNGGSTWQASQDSVGQTPYGGSPYWTFINTPGWGWAVEMLSDDPLRDITVRSIWVYSDLECTTYLYNTGSFVQDGSHNNNYYTECPAGQRTATQEPVNLALHYATTQEGYVNLGEGGEAEALFWSQNQ